MTIGPPTLAGFQAFITGVMGITPAQLPATNPVIAFAFEVAVAIVNQTLAVVPAIYTLAVYNLAGDYVIQFAQDVPPSKFFARTRTAMNITGFVAGVVASSGDESTSQSLSVPEFMGGFTLSDLQNLKTPYGRQYLAFAQMYGADWGVS